MTIVIPPLIVHVQSELRAAGGGEGGGEEGH